MNALLLTLILAAPTEEQWVTLPGKKAAAKHIVLISGDEEYRSEEAMSQLARILNERHGFKCTVLFAIDPADGCVQPNKSNIPGLEALKTADLMVIFTRYRKLPDEQMQHIAEYLESGKPIIGLRTSTHAFNGLKTEKYAWMNSGHKDGGFGRQVLGENWVSHHGQHGKEGTRGRLVMPVGVGNERPAIFNGIVDGEIFGVSDVYGAKPLDSKTLVLGEVTETLKPDSKAVAGKKNDPMMPIAWTREYKKAKVFTTTMGCSKDLENEAFRRLLVNACFWTLGDKVPEKANVEIVGTFNATSFGFKKDDAWKPGKKPAEYFK